MNIREHFQGKRVAVIGLGPHGEMVADVKFLIKADAFVSVYDLRSEARLKNHLIFLRSVGLANYVCGSIPPDDLLDMDLIILSHEYPRDSSFLKAAHEEGIPIEYPETFLFKMAPPVTIVGIMGSCGKATVLSILEPLLALACEADGTQRLFTLDPESDNGMISILKKIRKGDVVLIRIVESMMKELCAMRVSPHVAIFTTVPPKGSYNESPFEILSFQTYNNFIIASDEVIDAIHLFKFQPKAKMLRTKPTIIPESWEFGASLTQVWNHDRENAALALQAAQLFKVPDEVSEDIMMKWKPLKGRLELVKKVKNIEFYNNTASVTPDSTIAGIRALTAGRNLVLIFGGADVGQEYRELYSILPRHVHTLILLPGSGTMKERKILNTFDTMEIISAPSIEEAVRLAFEHAHPEDKVLFSPAFGAVGIDVSRQERGQRFVKTVRGL